jgi:hypothetical protein
MVISQRAFLACQRDHSEAPLYFLKVIDAADLGEPPEASVADKGVDIRVDDRFTRWNINLLGHDLSDLLAQQLLVGFKSFGELVLCRFFVWNSPAKDLLQDLLTISEVATFPGR